MRSCHFFQRIVATATSAAALLVSQTSSASVDRWQVGGGIGLANVSYGPVKTASLGVELDLTYGLNDQFNLLVEATASDHGFTTGGVKRHASVMAADAGVAYTLDVIQIIPYAGFLIGGGRVAAGDSMGDAISAKRGANGSLDLVGAVGVDYQFSRSLTFGLAGRFHFFVTGPETGQYITVLGRAAYTWGF